VCVDGLFFFLFFLLYESFAQISDSFPITAASWKHVSCSLQAKTHETTKQMHIWERHNTHSLTRIKLTSEQAIKRSNKAQAIKSYPCVLLNIAVNQSTEFKRERLVIGCVCWVLTNLLKGYSTFLGNRLIFITPPELNS